MPVAPARRRPHRDEHRIGIPYRRRQVRPEPQTPRLDIVPDQLVQAGLVDRHHSLQKPIDLPRILVDAENIVTEVREAGPRHQTDVARTDHRYTHRQSSPVPGYAKKGTVLSLRFLNRQ